jgi:FkbH-like protein
LDPPSALPKSDKVSCILKFCVMPPEDKTPDPPEDAHRKEDLRNEIDQLLSDGIAGSAAARIDALWRQEPTLTTAAFLAPRMDNLRERLHLTTLRVAIVRSFTLEPVIPLLRAAAFCFRLDIQVHVGDYNAYMQEILDRNSSLYSFNPDTAIVAARTADIAPELWHDYSTLATADVPAVMERVLGQLEQAAVAFRERSNAALVLHTLEQPTRAAFGVLDSQLETSQADAIQTLNREIRRMARHLPGVYVLDYDALVARHGRLLWEDERKLFSVGLPIAARQLIHLANEWLRLLVPLSGRVAKALVVDLDNTLWGGVIGEDGMTGIKLGADYPGVVYRTLQKAILEVSRKGILLAICSKNNPEDALQALEKHPGMLLRPSDFSAMRINWNEKAQSLREIAAELNIGLDSVAFLDDNPFEREQVRCALPEVLVLDVPEDPMQYAAAVRDYAAFQRLTLSLEDRQRTGFYAEQRERAQVEQSFQSKEDFFRYLQQQAEVAPVQPSTLARVSQLTQKTNQFNLTTRRYTEPQLAEMAGLPGCQLLAMRVRDRFGDLGLVGVAITRDQEDSCEIDTFLLSCRVIGRSLETALLSAVAKSAAARGRWRLVGFFLPTRKNAPAKDFFCRSGFKCHLQDNEGSQWVLDLQNHQIACPEWIELSVINGEQP